MQIAMMEIGHLLLGSAKYDIAKELYEYIVNQLKKSEINIETGIFGADMKVGLINDGPVTIMLDSLELQQVKEEKLTKTNK